MYHQFGELQHTDLIDDNPYRKCQLCGKVKFERGDDYFNLTCQASYRIREDLRNRLQNNQ